MFAIELTLDEIALVEAIQFDPLLFRGDHVAFNANADLASRLTGSLLDRGGVPEPRLRYFTDPEYNQGGRGRSRQEVFELNGTRGEAILRHGNFLRHLHYFIYGANLSPSILSRFTRAVEDCGPITSGDIAPLGTTARQLARFHRLEPKSAADEFFKLCLDLGLSASNAASIRSSVQQLKLRH